MRLSTQLKVLGAATALALLAGCSTGSAIAPKPFTPGGYGHSLIGRVPVAVSPIALLEINRNTARNFKSFNSCPKAGPIVYISDYHSDAINIYTVPFAGQGPCGRIAGVLQPEGMIVKQHNLYVACTGSDNIQVFHRGQSAPYNTYTDPTGQIVSDVTVAKDGTVIASNVLSTHGTNGSISTWMSGPHGGTFVGNFPMVNDQFGLFVTVQKDGTLYFNDIDNNTGYGLLWTGSCPLGHCGTFTSTGATTNFPGGLRSADGEEVVQLDWSGDSLITYKSFPNGTACSLTSDLGPVTEDINRPQHHVFIADFRLNQGVEYTYPGCVLIGTVPGNVDGLPFGIAKDYPEVLK